MQVVGETHIDFVRWRGPAIAASVVVIAIGMVAVYQRRADLFDIDFTGGVSVQVLLKPDQRREIADVRTLVSDLARRGGQLGRRGPEMKDREYKIDTSERDMKLVQQTLKEKFRRRAGHLHADLRPDPGPSETARARTCPTRTGRRRRIGRAAKPRLPRPKDRPPRSPTPRSPRPRSRLRKSRRATNRATRAASRPTPCWRWPTPTIGCWPRPSAAGRHAQARRGKPAAPAATAPASTPAATPPAAGTPTPLRQASREDRCGQAQCHGQRDARRRGKPADTTDETETPDAATSQAAEPRASRPRWSKCSCTSAKRSTSRRSQQDDPGGLGQGRGCRPSASS